VLDDVRAFDTRTVRDHGREYRRLTQLADTLDVSIAHSPDAGQRKDQLESFDLWSDLRAQLVRGSDRLLTGYCGLVGIDEVLARHEGWIMTVPGVVGVGATERGGQPAVSVMLSHVTPESKALPEEIDGYPVVIEVTGEITALPAG
jgi:hypothetical protein